MSLYVFQENEKEFQKRKEEFDKLYQQYSMSSSKKILIEKMKISITQADQQQKFMDIECNTSNPTQKAQLAPKVRKCRQEFNELKKRLAELEQSMIESSARSNVLPIQEQKHMQINNQLISQTYELQDANRLGEQTLDVAHGIGESLKKQKEWLLNAIQDTQDLKMDLGRTNRQVGMMRNRETFNKGILISLIGVLTIGNLLIIFYKFQ